MSEASPTHNSLATKVPANGPNIETSTMLLLHIASVCQPSSKCFVGCTLQVANHGSFTSLLCHSRDCVTSDFSDRSQQTLEIPSQSSGSFAKWSKSLGSSTVQPISAATLL